MLKDYFSLDEDFSRIIKKSLSDKEIIKIKPISTGWTNIVFEVTTDCRKFLF